MKVIVGLGNPGREFSRSRHNVGFLCLDRLAKAHGLAFSQRQARASLARGRVGGQELALAKPRTFMNRSGLTVAALVRQWQVNLSDLLVVYDDMDLPLSKLRLRPKGSAGGHHGMASIIAALGSQDFPRLRVGIGHPEVGDGVAHVLGDFLPSEKATVQAALDRAVQAIDCLIAEGLEKAMNIFNKDEMAP